MTDGTPEFTFLEQAVVDGIDLPKKEILKFSESECDTAEPESAGCLASTGLDDSYEHHIPTELNSMDSNVLSTSLQNIDISDKPSCNNRDEKAQTQDNRSNDYRDINFANLSHMTNIQIVADSQNLEKVKARAGNINECSFNTHSRILGTSTVSLNEQNSQNSTNMLILKSPFSRSAENILIADQNLDIIKVGTSNNELNADKILSQFAAQKNKVSATQKIPENSPITELKYSKIPKELLSQDIGSIVKNVHGIFSSVSGSLKNAYNQTQKPIIKNVLKPIPNCKVMDDIFEDAKTEKTIEPNVQNNSNFNVLATEKSNVLEDSIEAMEANIDTGTETNSDVYRLQIESLQKVIGELRKENTSLRDRVRQQDESLNVKDQMFKELDGKIDLMSKRVEQAEREKDAAVMRYASVECAAIEAKNRAETSAKAERAASIELELVQNKLKSAHGEKQRICQMYDDKCHALQLSEREVAKLREDLRELEGRLKWTQSKLRIEMDAYKESAEKVERLSQQVSELEAAKETAILNSGDSARAKQLELDLKESQAALILCKHEKSELDKRLSSTTQQYDVCKRERDAACASLSKMGAEIEKLKATNLHLEEEAAELAALRAQAALADTLSAQLQRESERALQAEEALTKERARAETCARREAAALEHSARLTSTHVSEREKAAHSLAKAQALAADNASLRERICSLEQECTKLQTALSEETERRNKENKVLARKVAELTEDLNDAIKKLEWEKGENSVLKKKHQSAIKELNRELQRSLKRCEQLEAKIPHNDANSARTGSISSLSSSESAAQEERLQNGHSNDTPEVQNREPDRQTLIERIVALQRDAARRADRCEFLEEHNKQLTEELRKKAKLLRHLLPAAPHGAMDNGHQHTHKKEIARLGSSSMAALWGDDPSGITLELSLEMNKKLQAVLEDTLLKNITLKENMDTLGEEIARLKQQKSADTK